MKKLFVLFLIQHLSISIFAQSISLDPNSLQLPRLAVSPTCAVADKGKMIYNTSQEKVLYCNGTTWIDPATGGVSSDWLTSGSNTYLSNLAGKVGIGTSSPTVPLHILHGGGVGIRVKSSSSYSGIDMDGANGENQLSFFKSGVFKWYLGTNATNNFDIGQVGGISRLFIDSFTGFIGMGTTTPTAPLNIIHSGGDQGILLKSNSNWSAIDLDVPTNKDAALRFYVNGVGQWNVRNVEVTNDFEINELGIGARLTIANSTGRVGIGTTTPTTALQVVGTITGTAKAFTIDHPLDPENKILRHFSIESPEMQNFYNGNATTDANGKAIIVLPNYFEALNTSPRYQLTTIGSPSQAYISKKIEKNQFEITTTQPNIEVSWEVKGVRNDAWAKNENTLKTEEMKPTELKGKYFNPKAFNKPESMGMNINSKSGSGKSSVE